jgi:hypothetical protein
MSGAAIRWVRRQLIPDGSLKAVLMELASVSRDGVNAWPSQATISSSTGLSARTVWQSLLLLDVLGVISRKRRSRGRGGRSSDMISLNVHREFELTRVAIRQAKTAIRASRRAGPDRELQLANSAGPTRKGCERIKSDKQIPIQGGNSPTYQGMALGRGKPLLSIVGGTATSREGTA